MAVVEVHDAPEYLLLYIYWLFTRPFLEQEEDLLKLANFEFVDIVAVQDVVDESFDFIARLHVFLIWKN